MCLCGVRFLWLTRFTHCFAYLLLTLLLTGKNTCGQLGRDPKQLASSPTPLLVALPDGEKATAASCSIGEFYGHTTISTSSGNIYSWGSNYKGKLGTDLEADSITPVKTVLAEGFANIDVQAGGIHNTCLADNRVFTWGCGSDGR
jgi:alpha-tubulin suppressor-like RCC1 family protein